ncbi:hypothetical protein PVAP13_3KG127000 [Panicum virgatum]|uniref:Secreted protein n=1 Tax=Panicum virgatum TaxID=38727 RepID=A0A8T0UQ05_PANVG|nr:hypothetical protein PVAP13_3KG127000 [Panicum virgatum]
MSIGAILLLSILSGVDAADGSRWSRSKEMCFPSAMFALRVFWFLVFGSVAVVVLRPRCNAEGELFCFLPSSYAVACVGGERDLVVAALCMVLADDVLCGGFGTDGFVMFSYALVTDSSGCFSVPSKPMAATATLTSQATTRWRLCGILGGVVPSSSPSLSAEDLEVRLPAR